MTDLKEKLLGTIAFDRWRFSIQTAMDIDQLMLVVSAYMSGWTKEQLLALPLLCTAPKNAADLMALAVEANRAEVHFTGPADQYPYIREFALTLAFAATRLRYLQALIAPS